MFKNVKQYIFSVGREFLLAYFGQCIIYYVFNFKECFTSVTRWSRFIVDRYKWERRDCPVLDDWIYL
jgi:hypothetical protein